MIRFIFFFLLVFPSFSWAEKVKITVGSFANKSEYKAGKDFSEYLKKEFLEIAGNVLATEYSLSGAGAKDFSLSVSLDTYELRSSALTSYAIGGYVDIVSSVKLSFDLRDAAGKRIASDTLSAKTSETDIGFSLLGGPVGDDRYKNELELLWSLPWEDKKFRHTVIYASFSDALHELIARISAATIDLPSGLKAKITDKAGEVFYFDKGINSGIKSNNILTVYTAPKFITDRKTGEVIDEISAAKIGKITLQPLNDRTSKGQIQELEGPLPAVNDYVIFY